MKERNSRIFFCLMVFKQMGLSFYQPSTNVSTRGLPSKIIAIFIITHPRRYDAAATIQPANKRWPALHSKHVPNSKRQPFHFVPQGSLIIKLAPSIQTHCTAADLKTLGISRLGSKLRLTALGKTFRAVYDQYPFVHSQKGEFVALVEPNHSFILIAHHIFGHESAADRAGRLRPGDTIQMDPIVAKPGKITRHPCNLGQFYFCLLPHTRK
jgi:hypothetical protein